VAEEECFWLGGGGALLACKGEREEGILLVLRGALRIGVRDKAYQDLVS
jgi:hypothetical protein